jgi:SAM-dependent methyltransferase
MSDDVSHFWNLEARSYEHKNGKRYLFYDYNRRNDLAFELVTRFATPGVVVDFGCGPGYTLSRIASRFAACYGVDVSEEMIAKARRNVASGEFLQGSYEMFTTRVDCAIAVGVLEYLHDPQHFIAHVRSLMKDNAVMVFTVNRYESFFGWVERCYRHLKRWLFPGRRQSLNRQYRDLTVSAWLSQNQLEIYNAEYYGFRSNAFTLGWLRYLYPALEVALDRILIFTPLRKLVASNMILVVRPRRDAASNGR